MRELIDKLRKNNIHISLADGNLKLSFDNEPEMELLDEIKSQKQEIVAYLKQQELSKGLINKTERKDILIAPNQLKLWAVDKLLGKSNLYNIPSFYSISGTLSIANFSKAWSQMLRNHEILRTVFIERDSGDIYQVVTDHNNPTQIIDARSWSTSEKNTYIKTICQNFFDLQKGPLCLSVLLQTGPEEFVWVLNFHHIIFDGWSTGVFLNQFKTIYQCICENKSADSFISGSQLQYKDYSAWHNSLIAQNQTFKRYWQSVFKIQPERIQLPYKKSHESSTSHQGGSIKLCFDEVWLQQLKRICSQEKSTLFSALFALTSAALSKLSGQTDIIIGTPCSGRDHPQLQELIGFFVNTVPVRNNLDLRANFRENLNVFSNNINQAFENQWLPFDQIVDESNISFDPFRNPLFDVFIAIQNIDYSANSSVNNTDIFSISPYNLDMDEVAKFDLTFAYSEFNGELELYLNYDKNKFGLVYIESIKEVVQTVFNDWVSTPNVSLAEVKALSVAAYNYLNAICSNRKGIELNNYCSVFDKLEEVFISKSTEFCLSDDEYLWSYSDLSQTINKIAYYLKVNCLLPKGSF